MLHAVNAAAGKKVIEGLSLAAKAASLIPKGRGDRTNNDEQALMALSDAYFSTHRYYEYRKTNPRDKQQELDLAYKWECVGILLKKYDDTLSERLKSKSRYWKEGETWSLDIIRQAKIGLEDIKREVDERIMPLKPSPRLSRPESL
jgi:hypothetical protein